MSEAAPGFGIFYPFVAVLNLKRNERRVRFGGTNRPLGIRQRFAMCGHPVIAAGGGRMKHR